MKTTITTDARGHGMQPGDRVVIHEPRLRKLRKLLTRPRVTVVGEGIGNTFALHERRMTWGEWWRAMQAAIFG